MTTKKQETEKEPQPFTPPSLEEVDKYIAPIEEVMRRKQAEFERCLRAYAPLSERYRRYMGNSIFANDGMREVLGSLGLVELGEEPKKKKKEAEEATPAPSEAFCDAVFAALEKNKEPMGTDGLVAALEGKFKAATVKQLSGRLPEDRFVITKDGRKNVFAVRKL